MAYAGAQATTSITVVGVTITLTVTPSPPWLAGQTITLKATVMQDSTPWDGAYIDFRWNNPSLASRNVSILIGTVKTDINGVATLNFQIPWYISGVKVPGDISNFFAVEESTSVPSNTVSGKVAYPTRLSIVSSVSRALAGVPFTITGKLEYQSDMSTWTGIGGMTISLFYDSTPIANVTTASDGSYSYGVTISKPGTYTLKAVFAGYGLSYHYSNGLILAPSTAELTLSSEGGAPSGGGGISTPLLVLGGIALAIGGALVLRRKTMKRRV